ncbi:Aldehyde dehydrogenase [Methylophaga frappieri]|uniref:Aldehyde dehydrogenase n=1 Tax=Methylophaga frappieri (strain ATCC BAA-2434 / DSM 25690 / JAM7) TaxID=754477 RepID=I1YGA0_METFJ|nr:coniferyl aldehyde dehydrogenase [Methylophaga frappieri]AFJ01943.1 Aldehyde dehydrogenase [Methylophaga frappieri]
MGKMNRALMLDTLTHQRQSFLTKGTPTVQKRRSDLKKLRLAIVSNRQAIEDALIADFGSRSRHETVITEIMTLLNGIDYLHKNLRRFMRSERRHVPLNFQPAKAYVTYQPLGVIGIISPWNFPVALALMPLATALAAGNRAMLKPSELTPHTSQLLEEILSDSFSPEDVAVVQGDADTGKQFSQLPFDHLFFTGSTQVARHVMRAASENLVPVTLELGGKSPVVIDPDHPIDHAAKQIAYGKLANSGQVCIAPDYAFVPESKLAQFIADYDAAVKSAYPDGPDSHEFTSLINHAHFDRLTALIEDAKQHGARIENVGFSPEHAKNREKTIAPSLVLDATNTMKIMQEEIFGPILPVITYQNIDQVIDFINAKSRPLALYYFGPENKNRQRLLTQTTSGNVTVNGTILHVAIDDLPFGGVGLSGMGAYHGIEGFRTMSHAKGIFEMKKWNLSQVLTPPFGKFANLLMKLLIR